jgi:hypothetical protein
MNWEYIISGLALLISIIFSLITIFSNRKKDKFEIKKGEILTLSLLGRYFAIQYNCWDQNGHMKSDKISINIYVQSLQMLITDINTLINNPFYIELLKKYPEINLLILLLLKNINERKNATIMAVDYNLFKAFFELYNKIKIEIKDKDLLKTPFYKEMEVASNFLNEEIPKLMPIQ